MVGSATATRSAVATQETKQVRQRNIWGFITGTKERYFNEESKGLKGDAKKSKHLGRTLEHDEYFGQNGILGSLLSTPFGGRANKFAEDFIREKHPDHLEDFKNAENKAAFVQENFSEEAQGKIYDHVAGSRLSGKINFLASLFYSVPQLLSSRGPAEFVSNLLNIAMNSFGVTRLFAMLTAMLPPGIAPVADTLLNLFGWGIINNAYQVISEPVTNWADELLGFKRQDLNNPQMAAAGNGFNSSRMTSNNYSQDFMRGGGGLSAIA
ncbi:MAG: hypothetical protein SFU25_10850 [Candidatus Caenarcaniphilales bacterium]|nr:hypothetical protein [Candidatus Caenarcaniphilales bacterium]